MLTDFEIGSLNFVDCVNYLWQSDASVESNVSELRAFNRFYTSRIGMLADGLLGSEHPFPDARVIYELERPTEVRDLRAGLAMDAGFLSRVLTRLETAGLVEREASPDDRRRQIARLTDQGHAVRSDLDERSAAANGELLGALSPASRSEVLSAMRSIRAALEPTGDVTLRPPAPGDLGWIVARHGALYADEYGWDQRFEQLVAGVVAVFEALWIAEVGGARAGSVMCVHEDERTARLRLLLVEPWARGLGLGGRLVDECLAFARRAGYERMVLWTNDVLTDARRLYERRGFELVAFEPHAHFGAPAVGQEFALDL